MIWDDVIECLNTAFIAGLALPDCSIAGLWHTVRGASAGLSMTEGLPTAFSSGLALPDCRTARLEVPRGIANAEQ